MMKAIRFLLFGVLCSCGYSMGLKAKEQDAFAYVDFSKVPKATSYNKPIDTEDVANLIPFRKLEEGDTQNDVQSKILDQGVNSFLKSDIVQHSPLGQTAKTIETSLRADMEIPKTKSDEINHRLSFQYQAFQREAKFRYRGFFDLDVKYNTHSSDFHAEISQDLGGKTLVLGHEYFTSSHDEFLGQRERLSSVSMRWNW